MQLPASIKSPDSLLPAIGALLCLVMMGWTVVWGIQLQMAHTIAGEPPQGMTTYWVTLGVLTAGLLSMLFWGNRLTKPSAGQVCYRRRPLLESHVQRLALRQLMRFEARL
jgi:hypothetical protein